jgi:hypothetical protein
MKQSVFNGIPTLSHVTLCKMTWTYAAKLFEAVPLTVFMLVFISCPANGLFSDYVEGFEYHVDL